MMLQRHLDAHVLVGVVAAVVQDLGLGLVRPDVVRDLHRPQLAALVALADAEARRDGRVRIGDGLGRGADLGVRVVAREAPREVGRRDGRGRGDEEDDQRRGDRRRDGASEAAIGKGHRSMMTPRVQPPRCRDGASRPWPKRPGGQRRYRSNQSSIRVIAVDPAVGPARVDA